MEYFITKEWENFKHLASSQGIHGENEFCDNLKMLMTGGFFIGFSFSEASIAAEEWRSKWKHS